MTDLAEAPITRPAAVVRRRGFTPVQWAIVFLAGFSVVSLVRVITGAENLTSVGAIQSAITAAVPIALAGLGGLWSERAGVVNIGLEGMMVLGTFGCGFIGYQWGPWAGVVAGILCGLLGGLLLALSTVTFGVDHIIAGVAISIVAPGLALFVAQLKFGGQQSPPVADVFRITIPGLSDWLGTIADKGWFLISDIAGVLGGLTTQLSALSLIAAVLIAGSGWILWRTRFGLRLRSCGEAPYAAESLGVNVYKYKYIAVIISGAISGLAGAFLVVGLNFQNGQTAGRGYIGLASLIFGNWRPGWHGGRGNAVRLHRRRAVVRCHRRGDARVPALVALALLIYAALQFRARNTTIAIVTLSIAVLALIWYFSTDTLPAQLVKAAPYTITLLVMALASQRLRPPKADGMPYRKGSGR